MITTRLSLTRDLLETGPQTSGALATALGCDQGQVAKYVERLRQRGYGVQNMMPPGSRYGALYVLVRRPQPCRSEGHCQGCGTTLAKDHAEDALCSPCERKARDGELGMEWAETLPGVDLV